MNKEELYSQWEIDYDNSSWEDILSTIKQIIELNMIDQHRQDIINFVLEKNEISWLQYKSLRQHLYYHSMDKKKKYGPNKK